MVFNRSKNSRRNLIYGLIHRSITILLPFITRTVMIKVLGEQYLGLNGLFSSILSVLSLAELGLSSAVVYNMYRPVADNDNATICALLNYYRKAYRIIGCVILGVGLAVIPFLDRLINGTYPEEISLCVVYLAFLINVALSYFMNAYLYAVTSAYQRVDIDLKIAIFISAMLNCTQITVLYLTESYYLYLVCMPISTFAQNVLLGRCVKKMFPYIRCRGQLNKAVVKDIKYRIRGLFVNKLCAVSRNAFDSIFISAFLGLTMTAIYNNYYYVMSAVLVVLGIVSSSITSVIGNSLATESKAKNYSDMNHMNFSYMVIAGWCTICLLCLLQPFMKIWVGEKLMFDTPVVILLCIYFYILKMGDIRSIYIDAAGLWWENRYRAIVEAVCNLGLNYILGRLYGVYGIIIATLISLFFINFCYGSTIIFKCYFTNQKASKYFSRHFVWTGVTMVIAATTYWICSFIQLGAWTTFLVRAAICIVVPCILYCLIYSKYEFGKESVKWLMERIK